MAVHVASRRVMEKAGMRPIREFHSDWPVRIEGDEHGYVGTRPPAPSGSLHDPLSGKAREVQLAECEEQVVRCPQLAAHDRSVKFECSNSIG